MRYIRYSLYALLLSVATLVLFNETTYAKGEVYYWDGNQTIQMVGGDIDRLNKANKIGDDDDMQAIPFSLESKDGYAATYKAININITTDGIEDGNARNYICKLQRAYLHVDRNTQPAKATLTYSEDDVKVQPVGSLPLWIDNIVNDGSARQSCLDSLNNLDWRQPKDIQGKPGQNAILYRFSDQLQRMHDREKSHYVHRVCGISPGGSFGTNISAATSSLIQSFNRAQECGNPVRDAYDSIWEMCRYRAERTIWETSSSMGYSENAGAAQVESFRNCVQTYSGLDINGNILNHLVALDILSYQDTTSCSIQYIGWVVCPTARFLGKLVDSSFNVFKYLFTITPIDTNSDSGTALYAAWSAIRNIANVFFVILFMLLILSQLSNVGISNYGIKKLLPKLIVTAILVNASYVLCAVAVDLSNVLGSTIHQLLTLLKPNVAVPLSDWGSIIESILIYTAPPVGTGLVLLSLSVAALFPLLIGAALSLVVVVILIIARYAIILSLIILSPIAIACSLLPNTKSWYKKWQSMFVSMLILYPIIAIVYGASTIAGLVIVNSGFARPSGEVVLQLFGLAAQLLPLVAAPLLLLKFGGPALSQANSMMRSSKLFGAARKSAEGFAKRRKNARDVKALQHSGGNKRRGIAGMRDRVIQRRYKKKALREMAKDEYHKSQGKYISDLASSDTRAGRRFVKGAAKGGGSVDRIVSNAVKAQHHFTDEAVKGHKLLLNRNNTSVESLTRIASDTSVSEEVRQAALELVLEKGHSGDIDNLVKASGGMGVKQRRTLAEATISGRVAGMSPYYGNATTAQRIINGEIHGQESFTQHVVAESLNNGESSARGFGSSSVSTLNEIARAIDNGHVTDSGKQGAVEAARGAMTPSNRSAGESSAEQEAALNRISRS